MNIGGLNFEVISPSAFKLIGYPTIIIYASGELVLPHQVGWYLCDEDGSVKHSKPFKSRNAAVYFLVQLMRNGEEVA